MANMGYCRFENTANDLRDCEEWLSQNEPDDLSAPERRAFERLIKRCARLADDYRHMFEEAK